jgi:hypothetical protein
MTLLYQDSSGGSTRNLDQREVDGGAGWTAAGSCSELRWTTAGGGVACWTAAGSCSDTDRPPCGTFCWLCSLKLFLGTSWSLTNLFHLDPDAELVPGVCRQAPSSGLSQADADSLSCFLLPELSWFFHEKFPEDRGCLQGSFLLGQDSSGLFLMFRGTRFLREAWCPACCA